MKARFGESEIPCPQIIIEAETETERLLLRVFCSYHAVNFKITLTDLSKVKKLAKKYTGK